MGLTLGVRMETGTKGPMEALDAGGGHQERVRAEEGPGETGPPRTTQPTATAPGWRQRWAWRGRGQQPKARADNERREERGRLGKSQPHSQGQPGGKAAEGAGDHMYAEKTSGKRWLDSWFS